MKSQPEFRRQMVASFHASKQSQRAFAEANKIHPSTLRYWLRRFSQDSPTRENEDLAQPAQNQVNLTGRANSLEDAISSIQRLEVRLEKIETLPRILDEAHQLMGQINNLAEEVEEIRQDTVLRADQLEATEFALSGSHLDDRLLVVEKDLAQLAKDFNLLSVRVEKGFAEVERNIRDEAAAQFNNLSSVAQAHIDKIYEYFSLLPAEVLDMDNAPQELDSEAFGEEFNAEDSAEHQLVASLLSDPRFSEPLILEDLQDRLTTVERVWQDIEEEEVPRRLSRLEIALAREKTSSAIKQTERRIAYAQEYGPGLVRIQLTVSISAEELCASLRNQEEYCVLDVPTAREIINHLQVRRILVLQGAPGTGKSRLARNLAKILISDVGGTPFSIVSMHPDLSHYDFIGGQKPIIENGKNSGFGPHLGHLSQAILAAIEAQGRHWLILDEINRGDISALMSSVLDGLELGVGRLGHDYLFTRKSDSRGILPIPGSFRIIGTMNSFDEDQLFKFSEALNRRIGFVTLPPLSKADESFLADRVIAAVIEGRGGDLPVLFKQRYDNMLSACAQIFELVGRVRSLAQHEPRHVFRFCEIGSGIVLDTLKHACLSMVSSNAKHIEEAVDLAVAAVLLSHLANRDIELLVSLRDTAFAAPQFRHCRQRLEDRIRELQVF